MRKCVGCNEMKPKKELARVLRTTDGAIILDATGKANGRGAYVCKDDKCLARAIKTKALERSLKVPVDPSIFDQLREGLM